MGVRDRFKKKLLAALNREKEPPTPKKIEPPPPIAVKAPSKPKPDEKQLSPPVTHVEAPPTTPKPTLGSQKDSQADAPTRNAHLRPSFNTSSGSFTVSILNHDNSISATFPCEPSEFVLEAAERAGVELPYSCRSGGCLSCTGKLIEGETEMSEQFVLEENHIAEGFRLLCCTTIQSNATFASHQEEMVD